MISLTECVYYFYKLLFFKKEKCFFTVTLNSTFLHFGPKLFTDHLIIQIRDQKKMGIRLKL